MAKTDEDKNSSYEDQVSEMVQNALEKTGVSKIPPQVHEVTQRHIIRLAALVRQLRAAGIDEVVVANGTKQLLASYEKELVGVLMDLAGGDKDNDGIS